MTTNIMAVVAHADDEILGPGGTLAWHVARGDKVKVVQVTRGDPSRFSAAELLALQEEARAAARIVGIHERETLEFLAPTLDRYPIADVANEIRRHVQTWKPTVILTHFERDIHQDHQIVSRATAIAVRPTTDTNAPDILQFETPSETEWSSPCGGPLFSPSFYVSLTSEIDTKVRAFDCYKSQTQAFPHPRSAEGIRALARMRGAAICRPAAEAFMVARMTYRS